eukprot:gene2115-1982_t
MLVKYIRKKCFKKKIHEETTSLTKQKKQKKQKNLLEHKYFTKLARHSIKFLIFFDLLQAISYLPLVLIQIFVPNFNEKYSISYTLLQLDSELTESLVLSLGIWSFFITLSIYLSLKSIKSKNRIKSPWFWRISFLIGALGLPLVSWVLSSILALRFQVFAVNQQEFFFGTLATTIYHSISYLVVETLTNIMRIMIVVKTFSIFKDISDVTNEKLKIVLIMILYTLPFTITLTGLILRRTYTDINLIATALHSQSVNIDFCMGPVGFVFDSIHKLLFPLRGFLDALVYAIVNGWFTSCSCCKTSEKKNLDEQDETENATVEVPKQNYSIGKRFNDISSSNSYIGLK